MSQPQSAQDQIAEAWRRHRPYLVNLAYQMLGDIGDAEDVAQEAFLRLARADFDAIDDIRAWLTVVTGRLCLDQVRSARARYERPGDIDPEVAALNQSGRLDPADRVTLDDEVRTALLEVLRRLSPAERVSFVLHDVLAVPFDEIAETVGRPVGTCRQHGQRVTALKLRILCDAVGHRAGRGTEAHDRGALPLCFGGVIEVADHEITSVNQSG